MRNIPHARKLQEKLTINIFVPHEIQIKGNIHYNILGFMLMYF